MKGGLQLAKLVIFYESPNDPYFKGTACQYACTGCNVGFVLFDWSHAAVCFDCGTYTEMGEQWMFLIDIAISCFCNFCNRFHSNDSRCFNMAKLKLHTRCTFYINGSC